MGRVVVHAGLALRSWRRSRALLMREVVVRGRAEKTAVIKFRGLSKMDLDLPIPVRCPL